MLIYLKQELHLRDLYCFRSDLLPTIKQTMSSVPQFLSYFNHLSKFSKEDARVISYTNKAPTAPRQQALAIDLYLYCPAVSQICTFIDLSSTLTTLVANSTPMVVLDQKLNSFLVNFDMMLDFPTPESPTKTIFNCISESSFFLFAMNIQLQTSQEQGFTISYQNLIGNFQTNPSCQISKQAIKIKIEIKIQLFLIKLDTLILKKIQIILKVIISFIEFVEKGQSCSKSSSVKDDSLLTDEEQRAHNSKCKSFRCQFDGIQQKCIEPQVCFYDLLG